jgi:3-phosphoglycerate kinase
MIELALTFLWKLFIVNMYLNDTFGCKHRWFLVLLSLNLMFGGFLGRLMELLHELGVL